jgi:carbon-monoxide dehydrogenase medium subunit
LAEGLEALAPAGKEALPVAGGTNLIVDMRSRRHEPDVLVDISRLAELRGVRQEDGHVVAGAATTLAEILADPLVARHAAPLGSAAAAFASPLVRNRATLGGNLADGSPAADSAPPLLVLDAEVALASCGGTRWLPLDDFFVSVRKTRLQPGELLVAIRWPMPAPSAGGGFAKFGLRRADAISVVSAAVFLDRGGDGICRQARIALGAVAPRPIRARAAEAALEGRKLDREAIDEAAMLCGEAASPIDDVRGSAAYRRRLATVLVRRLLEANQASPRDGAR